MRRFGPKTAEHVAITPQPLCPACRKAFAVGDFTALVGLGPGDDKDEQDSCREGRAYNSVAVEVHWACATGQRDV